MEIAADTDLARRRQRLRALVAYGETAPRGNRPIDSWPRNWAADLSAEDHRTFYEELSRACQPDADP